MILLHQSCITDTSKTVMWIAAVRKTVRFATAYSDVIIKKLLFSLGTNEMMPFSIKF